MILLWYPHWTEDGSQSSVQAKLRKDLKKRPELMLRVETFLARLKQLKSLVPLEQTEDIAPLGGGLLEMRIPKTLRGGVVRIYFCYAAGDEQTIILLEAELKNERAPNKVDVARKRMRFYQEHTKRYMK